MADKAIIKGTNIFGEERVYEFNLLDAETGLEIFHQYARLVAFSWEKFKPFLDKFRGAISVQVEEKADEDPAETDLTLADVARLLAEVFDWPTLIGLSKRMIAGATIEANGKKITVPESGVSPFAARDPLEQYFALFFATCANWPRYLDFFVEAVDDSSTEGATATETDLEK